MMAMRIKKNQETDGFSLVDRWIKLKERQEWRGQCPIVSSGRSRKYLWRGDFEWKGRWKEQS